MKFSWEFLAIFSLIRLIGGSLIDYKACQQKFNCTRHLTPADCPPGAFLDTQLKSGCCHGCRGGIGTNKNIKTFIWSRKKLNFFPLKVAVKAAAARERNARRGLNAMPKIFTAFTIDVKRIFPLLLLHVQPFTFSIVFAFDAFR